jgi:hypothetical protein
MLLIVSEDSTFGLREDLHTTTDMQGCGSVNKKTTNP